MRHLQKPWYPQLESKLCLDTDVSIKGCIHRALARSSGQKTGKDQTRTCHWQAQ